MVVLYPIPSCLGIQAIKKNCAHIVLLYSDSIPERCKMENLSGKILNPLKSFWEELLGN